MHFPVTTHIIRPKHCDPLFLLRELGLKRDYCALLESADRQVFHDFSFVALGARDIITVQNGSVRGSKYIPDGETADVLVPFESGMQKGAPGARLGMGYIGFISFEAARNFEKIDLTPDPSIPDECFFLPEIIIKIDHEHKVLTLIMHEDSTENLAEIEKIIHASPFRDDTKDAEHAASMQPYLPDPSDIASYRQTSRKEFCERIEVVKENILAGEVFQVVLSQELRVPCTIEPHEAYEGLRAINPSPYTYYLQTPERIIVGASPETLVRIDGGKIQYRPIAGTRKRTGNPEKDRAMQQELLSDQKERAEHQMLVDLGRNDVGRVSEIGSVEVHHPFHIEAYAHVFHLVSEVTGILRSDKTPLDAVRSVFPAGTLTGAPKLRAMELIHRLEKGPRGMYGGGLGYIDSSGNLDLAITIRTMLFQNGVISLRVGAGIVKDSVPELEDDECLHKARSCLAALKFAETLHSRL